MAHSFSLIDLARFRRAVVLALFACAACQPSITALAQSQPSEAAPQATPLDQAVDAAQVEQFAPSGWQTVKLDLSSDQLSLAWEGMDSASRRSLLDALTACRTFIATNPKTHSVYNLTVIVFADEKTAQRAVSDLESMSRNNIESGAIPALSAEGVVYGQVAYVQDVDTSSTVAFTTDVSEHAVVDLYAARVARKNVVVEFMRINHPVSEEDAGEAITALLDEVVAVVEVQEDSEATGAEGI